MNLFILSLNMAQCAEWMIDKHISKMILEAVQMLCSAKRCLEPSGDHSKLYRITHKNHPVTIWIRTSIENYMWTLDMIEAMHNEWQYRYQHTKEHKSYTLAKWLRQNPPPVESFDHKGLTPFALAMPDEYKTEDPVESYQNYYRSKARFATWKRRDKPYWF
jgi:hypothetical protein